VTGAVRALVYPVPEVGVVVHAFNIGAATCGWGKGGEAARVVLERVGRFGGDSSPILDCAECRARRSDVLVGEDLAVDDATRGVRIFLRRMSLPRDWPLDLRSASRPVVRSTRRTSRRSLGCCRSRRPSVAGAASRTPRLRLPIAAPARDEVTPLGCGCRVALEHRLVCRGPFARALRSSRAQIGPDS